MRFPTLASCLILSAAVLLADTQHINVDEQTDFSKIKTFHIREGKANTQKPELNNPLFLKTLGAAIRTELQKKGLEETAANPDVFVDYRIDGTEISTVRGGERGISIPLPGLRGLGIPGTEPRPVRYSEGMLAIDITTREAKLLVWQGIYRDEESTGSKLAKKLPADAKKLLSKYPPKKK
jgi:hypothetical protein